MKWHQSTTGLYLPGSDPFDRRRRSVLLPTASRGMSRRRCCCATCIIFSDEFSTDDIATNWTQQTGTWSVGAGVLSTSSSNGVLTCNNSYPGGAFHNYTVDVKLKASTGNHSRIIFSYSGGAYNFAEVYWNGSASVVYLKKSDGTIVATSDSQNFTDGDWYSFRLCVTGTSAVVNILNTAPTHIIHGSVTSTSTTVGLGTGSLSGYVDFDDFDYEKEGCKQCAGIVCSSCASSIGPLEFLVSITITNKNCSSCASLNGDYVVSFAYQMYGACTWMYTFPSNQPCGATYINVTIGGSSVGVDMLFNSSWMDMLNWNRTDSGVYDCLAFKRLEIPANPTVNNDSCLAATCFLTAL